MNGVSSEQTKDEGLFAAVDFETADYGMDSACAVALVIADRHAIRKKYYRMIRPPRREFLFTYLHGIAWHHVSKKPSFGDVWKTMTKHLEDVSFIAAHNAAFDYAVLQLCCRSHGVKVPDKRFLCTMKLARMMWKIYPTSLPAVCRRLNLPLDHHNAKSDALACALIVQKAGLETLPEGSFVR